MAEEISRKKLICALLAISFGTILEWYDFTVYTQLSTTLSNVFFPSTDPAVKALSVWGIFAVGFISRPVGALLFGHMGDTRGRGTCLLVSVILMGVPTVIIGCLPTYAQAGIAAPALLATMRLIQGLAMGGEFGAAMVYLHEIALPQYKTVTGSLGFVSLGIGVVIGICVVAAVLYCIPADALLVWGWRVPFLLAIVTLVAAMALRYNMPESREFIDSRNQLDEERRKREEAAAAAGGKEKAYTDITSDVNDGDDVAAVTAAIDTTPKDLEAGSAAAAAPAAPTKHYVPLLVLFRGHWSGILSQIFYEAWVGAGFYLGYSWLPSFFVKHAGVPQHMTLWMTLSGMVLYTFVVPAAGWMADKGLGRVTATAAVTVVAGATSIPMFMAFATKSLAACWVLQLATLAMAGYTMGILPAICSNIYPAGVRISGFNFAYNMGMMIFGGLTPLILTTIQKDTGSIYLGPGIWMTSTAGVTVLACFALLRLHPASNK